MHIDAFRVPWVAILAVGFVGGAIVMTALPIELRPGCDIASVLALAGVAASGWRTSPTNVAVGAGRLGVSAVALGALSCALRCSAEPPVAAPALPRGDVRLLVRVDEVRHAPRGTSCWVTIEQIRPAAARDETAALRAPPGRWSVRGLSLAEGAHVAFVGSLRPKKHFQNPSPHPAWPETVPRAGAIRPSRFFGIRVVRRSPLREGLARWRDAIRQSLDDSLPRASAELARALVLGEGEAVDVERNDWVKNAGLTHVLAVSGLHVAIIIGLVVKALGALLVLVPWLSRRLDCRRIACAFGVPLAPLYAAFAGGAPSAYRAALSASLTWLFVACGRRPRALTMLSAASLLLVALDPAMAIRPAFLLSVLATLAVLSTSHENNRTWRSIVSSAVRTSVLASLATAPVVVWCFGGVPVISVVANVCLVAFGSFVLIPLSCIHALLSLADLPPSQLTAVLFDHSASFFFAACKVFSSVSLGRDLPPPTVAQGIALAIAAMALVVVRSTRWRKALLAAALVTCGVSEWALRVEEKPERRLRATFLDVWQGDSALIDMPNGKLVLVDAGGRLGGVDPGQRVLEPLLKARRRDRIDLVILTHPHPDHYEGLLWLAGRFPIVELWDNGQAVAERPDGLVAQLLARLRRMGTRVVDATTFCRQPRAFGNARLRALWPCPAHDPAFDENDNSIVLDLRYEGRTLLLMGDAEGLAERELAAQLPNAVDVLKVGHHGSRTSTTATFLERVRPRAAVISCGEGNVFGHPHPEVVERLRVSGARVFRTDRDGALTVTIEPDRFTLRPFKSAEAMQGH